MKQKQECLKNMFIIGIFMLGVIFLRVFYITRTTGPFIYADEFGYWSHAAHMTGHTWAGAMEGVAWYSFGYSFWLALTFLFSNQMVVMYRIAILLNILMSLGIYGLAYGIIRKLAKEQGTIICGFIAFVTTCFPTYIFYSYTTMCETLVAFVVWLLFYEMVSLEERPIWWKGVLLGVTTGYAFMVHNRLLTVVFAVCVCVIILWSFHRIDWKIIISFVVSALAMFLLYVIIKSLLQNVIVNSQAIAGAQNTVSGGTANTFGSIWRKFISLFTPDRIVRPFLSLMGQLWQCLSATYLLIGLGVIYAFRLLKRNLKTGQNICCYAYPLLACLFSVGLTSVVAYGPRMGTTGRVRIDPAFYGRYNECYYPTLVMMALLLLCEKELRGVFKVWLGVAVLYLALSVGMYFRLYGMDGYLNIVSAVSIHIFYWLGGFSVWKCSAIALLGSGVVIGLCYFRRMGQLGCCAGMLALTFLFSTTALYCMRTSIRGENDYTNQYIPVYDYLNENTVRDEVVYICEENKTAYDLQSRLVDKPVVVIGAEQLDEVKEDAYVVVREEQMEKLPDVEYEVCLECKEFLVLKLKFY